MTHLIIHPKTSLQKEYLLQQVNKILNREYTNFTQLVGNPDIHLIEQPEHVSISIDAVKKLQKEMIFRPFQEAYQIGVITNADNLTQEAQNALLKTLEEQSPTTLYYLLISNEKNLLDTILSRGVKHYVKRGESSEKEKGEEIIEPEILKISLPDQFTKIEELINQDKEDRSTIKNFITSLANYFRTEMTDALRSGENLKASNSKKILDEIELANQRISANVNKKLALENLMLTIKQSQ